MSGKKPIEENIAEIQEIVKNYVNARFDLLKLTILEKSTKASIYLFTTIAVILAITLVLMFLTFAFSFWYAKQYGNIVEGFLFSAGFYALLAVLLFIFRKPLFSNNVIRNLSRIMYSDDEKE